MYLKTCNSKLKNINQENLPIIFKLEGTEPDSSPKTTNVFFSYKQTRVQAKNKHTIIVACSRTRLQDYDNIRKLATTN